MWATVMFRLTLLIWIVFLGMSTSAPTDEFNSYFSGALSMNHDAPLKGNFTRSYSTPESQKIKHFDYFILEAHEHYIKLMQYIEKGTIKKGLIFNIYDEDMKEAAVSLFELIRIADSVGINIKSLIKFEYLNEDLVSYVYNVNMIYNTKHKTDKNQLPIFVAKPNFFVNEETIIKAIKLSHQMNYFLNSSEEASTDQYYKTKDAIVINTNYSGWNLPNNGGEEELNYFREDISLNSYYYGVHLMHPFWMIDTNPKPNEHYYFLHQQLFARFLLEKEHLFQGNNLTEKSKFGDYNPYLIHDNGLPFPVRRQLSDWSEDRAQIQYIDNALRNCIKIGLLIIEKRDNILTTNNYVSIITKMFRTQFDTGRAAKLIRSLYGYGVSGYPYNKYHPAPSTLHYAQTSLRDPIYWTLMQHVLNYYTEYEKSIDPFHLYQHETKTFEIIDIDIPKITTFFDYYQFSINKAISRNESALSKMPLILAARQKRMKHSRFAFNFIVGSQKSAPGIVRLFLGPPCEYDCWDKYSRFFELDKFVYSFQEGVNTVTWSPESSSRLSSDEIFNMESSVRKIDRKKVNKYNMFKFPENLIIPRGLEKGLNLSLFIIITPGDVEKLLTPPKKIYLEVYNELDEKPLGFPFHRPAKVTENNGINYKYFNITIYHKPNSAANNGYFSPHLD